ncbi:high-potential iron-sulfur protein [Rhodopseudomonas pseudopalustris]|uniref:High-potential iron-sulfur protein n=2 Tax=Rhodopseudomonas TaxID=1073 RepID=Q133A0_RHOPS|nr:high-potential iron-sulfur protein [Rhodopseudomonas pseudopalustris]ABE40839.1 Twin-arginine translocation pathway signal [Rhodopseudomonas palustris BisB5]SEO58981.1 High potential iron-sulfur protein [Rhodopseudomonas pseudopalustris]
MTKTTREVCSLEVSRRDMFKVAAGAVGAAAIVGLTGSEVLAQSRMAKTAAQYQASPRSGQTCGKCTNYIVASSTCKVIDGTVSANGWCSLFVAKA